MMLASSSRPPLEVGRGSYREVCLFKVARQEASRIHKRAVRRNGGLYLEALGVALTSMSWRRQNSKRSLPAEEQDQYAKYLKPAKRVSSSDWLESIKGMPSSRILRRIRKPLLAMTSVSVIVTVAHCHFGMPALGSLVAHNILGSALSLLLVFRTNSAYQRFQEGRKIWNDILDQSRNIALSVSVYQDEMGAYHTWMICKLLQAFPFAMQRHCRSESAKMPERLQRMMSEIDDEMEGPQAMSSMTGPQAMNSVPVEERPRNTPLRIIARMMQVMKDVPLDGESFTNRERVWLLGMVNSLARTVGRCERLVQTPVPLSYARHTTRFVSVWTLMLPLALAPVFRWLTPPVVAIITWALFGILEIGHTIEDPFRRSIELTPICEAVAFDTARALGDPSKPPRAAQTEIETRPQSDSGGSKTPTYALSEREVAELGSGTALLK
mmetsp:Transcript_48453/g.113394  ORF Transcript_48453/g.113394 Transcript_48453/m.113394 type:complete len:439 (+) Transcript_48453:150-1466(+)